MGDNIELGLTDIANELFIMNKTTLDILWSKSANAFTLYCFYYKTAKWQKTNQIKANDSYVKKCLNWGSDKVTKVKKELKELGLISMIQGREKGRVSTWYIKVGYMVSEKKLAEVKIETKPTVSTSTKEKIIELLEHLESVSSNDITDEILEYLITRSSNQETNALRNITYMLKEIYNLCPFEDFKEDVELKEKTKKVSLNNFMTTWNETAKKFNLPNLRTLSTTRKEKLKTRIQNNPEFVELFAEALTEVSTFERFVFDSNWFNFDFLIANDNNILKVVEGNYRAKQQNNNKGQAQGYKNAQNQNITPYDEMMEQLHNQHNGNVGTIDADIVQNNKQIGVAS